MSVALRFVRGGRMMLEKPLAFGKHRGLAVSCRVPAVTGRRIEFGKHRGELLGSLIPGSGEAFNERDTRERGSLHNKRPLVASKEEDGQEQKLVSKSPTGRKISVEEYQAGNIGKETLDPPDPSGIQVATATYASLLRRCGTAKALSQGRRVHVHIMKSGQEPDRFLEWEGQGSPPTISTNAAGRRDARQGHLRQHSFCMRQPSNPS